MNSPRPENTLQQSSAELDVLPTRPAIGWRWFVFPIAIALMIAIDHVIRLVEDQTWEISCLQGVLMAALVVWLFCFGFHLRKERRRVQDLHFIQACGLLQLEVANSDELEQVISRQHEKLGLRQAGIDVLRFAENCRLKLAWVENSPFKQTMLSGRQDEFEVALVGMVEIEHSDEESSRTTRVEMPSTPDGYSRYAEVFRIESRLKYRYNHKSTLRRWIDRFRDCVDFTREEIVAAVTEKQATANHSGCSDILND